VELTIHKVYNRAVHSYLAVLEISPTREGEDPDIFVVKNLPANTGPNDAFSCPTSSSGQEVFGPCHYIGCPGGAFYELTDECLYREDDDVGDVVARLSSSAEDICAQAGGVICSFDYELEEQTSGYFSITASWCIVSELYESSSSEDSSLKDLYPLYLPCEETYFRLRNIGFGEVEVP
jgi:hypothetical protein